MNKIAVVLCLVAAVLEAITHDWLWTAADVILAVLNAKVVYDDKRIEREIGQLS